MGFLNTTLNSLLNIVFPAKCVSCGKSGADLCLSCICLFPPAERENANWIFSLYDYRHPPIRQALHLLKYKGKKRLTKIFAEVVYDRILEELSDLSVLENFNNAILIPIPLSPSRYRERGYNQAQLICEEIIKIDRVAHLRHGVNVPQDSNKLSLANNILIKPKETEHQARIKDRRTRLKNIIGSFAVKKENVIKIKNKNIILIDDITTTGATLTEAKKVLKQAGARKIIAFTIAH
jgi:ComF family protein